MQFQQQQDGLWVAKNKRGAIRLFGLPFALMSLVPFAGAVGLLELKSESGGEVSAVFLISFGLVFACFGLGFMLFQSGLTIDLGAKTITRWRRVLVPLWQKRSSTKGFSAVFHHKAVIRTDKSSRTVYPVELEASTSKSWLVYRCPDYRAARRTAEELARLLQLAVIDRTDGEDRRREYEDIDLSLREKRQLHDEDMELAPPPTRVRSRLTPHGDELEIDIPPTGFTALHWVISAAATGPLWLVGIFLAVMQRDLDTEMPVPFQAAALAFGAIPFTLALSMIVIHARRRWLVVVSPHSLHIETRAIRRRNISIPANELEELSVSKSTGRHPFIHRYVGGPPIVAISDKDHVSFGSSLPESESRYLAAMIRGIISAPIT